MVDHRPPNLAVDERATLQALLQFCRESVVRKVEGLDDDAAREPMVPSGTSVLWLVKHLTFAERIWVFGRFVAQPERVTANELTPDDTLEAVVAGYRQTWIEVDRVVAEHDLDEVCPPSAGRDAVNLRWILAHLVEETARHAGHADILRELLDGDVGR